ncbi:MAG: TIM barrel protein [Clostridiales bacterium]|nr:TIM barrel protein [Clostridiales bacterium]
MIRFGPSGNSDKFYEEGYKSSLQMPKWLNSMGLSAYEYQCGKGVKIKEASATKLKDEAIKNDIFLSIHAPYYISLSSVDATKRNNSVNYILSTLKAARWMGAKRIVVHAGSCSKMPRSEALALACDTLKKSIRAADENGFGDITICPETLGKVNQLGSVDEIVEMCKIDDRLIPTIDFGHIHVRDMGCLNSIDDFRQVLDKVENGLGNMRLKNLHIHFSRIEFTKGGEKRHWRLCDTQYGPDFEPLAQLIHEKNMTPVIICESFGTMAEDALTLKNIYESMEV